MGVVLLIVFAGARIREALLSRSAIVRFEATRQQATVKEPTNPADKRSSVDVTLWSEKRIGAYEQSLTQRFDPPIAILHVPKIQLEVPVLDGTDDLTLNRGVGRIAGTARAGASGNLGIAGHRDGFFRGLKDVQLGDTVELELADRTETFVVDDLRVVTPNDISVLQPTFTPSLTLVTCYPFYFIGSAPQRYIVHASVVHSAQLYSKAAQ